MLERTFIHAQGIGPRTERQLWRQGADSWETFLADPDVYKLPVSRRKLLVDTVSRSPVALQQGDFRFFQQRLAQREHWRAFHSFPGRVLYLDIETDGGTDFDSVTVVGVYDGKELRQYVRGENLLDFPEVMENAALLVTFFGGGFDIPVLRNAFPRVRFDLLHLDLCPALRRLGLQGGLKHIERVLGINRSEATSGLVSWDAVRLWRQWRYGSEEARRLLLTYNGEDVVNMVPLANLAYRELVKRVAEDE